MIRPLNLPWSDQPESTQLARKAVISLAERLKGLCSERGVVARWGADWFIVGIRTSSEKRLQARALAMKRALKGVCWLYGPVIHVEVTAAMIHDATELQTVLERLGWPETNQGARSWVGPHPAYSN